MRFIFIILFFTNVLCAQVQTEDHYIPYVTIKDTIRKVYVFECIGNHPNCWGGTRKVYKGLDTIRIVRTYIMLDLRTVLKIREEEIFIGGPEIEDMVFRIYD